MQMLLGVLPMNALHARLKTERVLGWAKAHSSRCAHHLLYVCAMVGAGKRAFAHPTTLLQPVRHLVERGLDADFILFAAGSAGGAGAADDFRFAPDQRLDRR